MQSSRARPLRHLLISIGGLTCIGLAGIGAFRYQGMRRRPEPTYVTARRIVDRHCTSCHSERPTVAAFPIAPNGVALDTAEQMQKYATRMLRRVVADRTMPLLNKTGMTDEERSILGRWVEAGARNP